MYAMFLIFGAISIYAGYSKWEIYVVPLISLVWAGLHTATIGARFLHIANGGPAAYILRIFIMNSIAVLIFYGIGVGFYFMIGNVQNESTWSWSLFLILFIASSILVMFSRGIYNSSNVAEFGERANYRAHMGSAFVGSLLAGALLAAAITAVVSLLS